MAARPCSQPCARWSRRVLHRTSVPTTGRRSARRCGSVCAGSRGRLWRRCGNFTASTNCAIRARLFPGICGSAWCPGQRLRFSRFCGAMNCLPRSLRSRDSAKSCPATIRSRRSANCGGKCSPFITAKSNGSMIRCRRLFSSRRDISAKSSSRPGRAHLRSSSSPWWGGSPMLGILGITMRWCSAEGRRFQRM